MSSPAESRENEGQENIEKVRRAIDAFNRRDVEAMVTLAGDMFEYDWSRSRGPNRGIYRGVEGFMEFVRDQWSMFDEVTLEAHEFIPRGPHVVITSTTHGRGRQGIPVSANSAMLYTFEEGRLVRVTLFQEREEALAAAAREAMG
jgi:ketosteroid isomerase-like protein